MNTKLIIGLGNPGNQYNFTRHNLGFLTLDFWGKVQKWDWEKPKHNAIWLKNDDKLLIKPQTFYNDSGLAVAEFLRYYKLSPADILVICDDFNLPFGEIRFRAKGSSGGNNGLKSITQHLKTAEFARIRVGTGSDLRQKLGDTDFVLSKFTPEEKAALPEVLPKVIKKIEDWL